MLVASLLVLLGLAYSIVAVQVADVRLSGVVVVPLASVYALYDLTMLPIFAVGVGLAYATIVVLRRRTLLWGRSLLLCAIVVGAFAPLALVRTTAAVAPTDPVNVAFLGSIFPGIAAYNYSREDADQRRRDVLASAGGLCSLLVVGFAIVNPTTASLVGHHTPPVLFAEWSDVATLRQARVPTGDYATPLPASIATLALLFGLALTEAAYARWGVRMTGMIAIPLVALFTVQHPVILPLYVAGVAVVFGVASLVAHLTLIYGRVLLSMAIGVGIVLAGVAALFASYVPGFVLLFLGILGGIGGYNVHRVPPTERRATLSLSAAGMACFGAGFWLLVPDPAIEPTLLVVAAALLAVLAGLRDVVALEEARTHHRVWPFARAER